MCEQLSVRCYLAQNIAACKPVKDLRRRTVCASIRDGLLTLQTIIITSHGSRDTYARTTSLLCVSIYRQLNFSNGVKCEQLRSCLLGCVIVLLSQNIATEYKLQLYCRCCYNSRVEKGGPGVESL